VLLDLDACHRALRSRDARFDGWFVTAVTATGIYCRPSCPAPAPRREHVRCFASAAAAQQAGYRACPRCRPDAAPGSPEWLGRADVAARAMRLILDGVVDREGVDGLAHRLGYSQRQLHRVLVAELGTGALALARAQRAQTARILLTGTELPVTEVAFGAGFSSLRQLGDTVRAIYARTPTELRRLARRAATGEPAVAQTIAVRLAHRAPLATGPLFDFLGRRAIAGVEAYDGTTYRRSLRLPHGEGTVALRAGDGAGDGVRACFALSDLRDLTAAIARCRLLLGLDADPQAVDAQLGEDPLLAPLVAGTPGLRVPGAVDGFELAVRAVAGQQVSLAGARTVLARLVRAAGAPLASPELPLTHAFPPAAAIERLASAGHAAFAMPGARRRTLAALAGAVAAGELTIDAAADPQRLAAGLRAIGGIGPWTAGYVAMRAAADPDVFLARDLGVRRGLAALGEPTDARAAERLAERWRPWRSYATMHLWRADAARPAIARSA